MVKLFTTFSSAIELSVFAGVDSTGKGPKGEKIKHLYYSWEPEEGKMNDLQGRTGTILSC